MGQVVRSGRLECCGVNEAWKRYAVDFNAMSDEDVEVERARAQSVVDEETEWLEAVASWEAAGKPRSAA